MNAQTPVVVQVRHRFAASAERVFDAWLNPATAGRWLFATPAGEMVRVQMDARVGGRYSIVERRGGEEVEHAGEYLELDRPRRLAFTFSVPAYSSTADRVTIEIAPLEHGCELTLTHVMGAGMAEITGKARDGWMGVLRGLEATLD
jgi:uncharacterized protein YndB with AHSA1/START domain